MLAKLEEAMVTGKRDIEAAVTHWLGQFDKALSTGDDCLLRALFHADSHWRDVLALTWDIQTVSGLDAIVTGLQANREPARPSDFAIDPCRVLPRQVSRAG